MANFLSLPASLFDLLACSLYAAEVALVILLVKSFFREQLSARWHFYIWVILLIRMVLPAQMLPWKSEASAAQIFDPAAALRSLRLLVDEVSQVGIQWPSHSGLYEANHINISSTSPSGISLLPEISYDSLPSFQSAAPFENSFQQTAIIVYLVIVASLLLYFIGSYAALILRLRISVSNSGHSRFRPVQSDCDISAMNGCSSFTIKVEMMSGRIMVNCPREPQPLFC